MNILLGSNPMLRITDEELQKNVNDATTYFENLKKRQQLFCEFCGRKIYNKKRICKYCRKTKEFKND